MDELIRTIAQGFLAAKARRSEQRPCSCIAFDRALEVEACWALEFLADELTPIIDKHVADNTVVSRKDLELLERLDGQRPNGAWHSIRLLDDGSGDILDTDKEDIAEFEPSFQHKTPEAALLWLLEPKEPEEPGIHGRS